MPPYSSSNSFSFAVLGYSAPPAPGLAPPTAVFRIYDDIGVLHPDMVFDTGNVIWASTADEQGTQEQLSRFEMFSSNLSIPMYVAPGSKDVVDEDSDVAFRHTISGGNPWRSFDYGNSHFVVLDSEVPGQAGAISGDQMTWLQSDLDKSTASAHIFVFVNRCPYAPIPDAPADSIFTDAGRDAFTALMAKYKVNSVFSGGLPMYAASVHDGVNYVTTGGGGGASTISPADGGFLHFVLVSVDHGNVSVSPIQPTRIDTRMTPGALGSVTVYNLTDTPLVLSRVGILVPSKWRDKKVGVLGADRLRVYETQATALTADGKKAVDVAPVELDPANPADPLSRDFDILYVRVQAPAASAINIKVSPAA
jgi:hypothetical protein